MMDLAQNLGQKLMLAFEGKDSPSLEFIHSMQQYRPAGVTLFRYANIDNPGQLRALTATLQRIAREMEIPPLLIGTDQEGGQLMAVGGGTQLPGNMALGATGSAELAYQAGEVLGSELAAMGINVNYAPCADVNINPQNPVVGVRSFGSDPGLVARLTAAMVRGIQSQGVAATTKHFPGHGDTSTDSHLNLPIIQHSLEQLRAIDFPPFEAAIQADTKLVMTAHIGLPQIDSEVMPATLSSNVLTGLLRRELGFEGVIITDAMDMHAIRQGTFLGAEAVRAISAGADLLLVTTDPEDHRRVYEGVTRALRDGLLNVDQERRSIERILSLKKWLEESKTSPSLDVVNCEAHRQVAAEIAEKSITLVRDQAHLLPLRLTSDQRIAVIVPQPKDLTPADTSSYIIPQLAASIRQFHPNVDEFIIALSPDTQEISSILQAVQGL